MRVSSDIPVQSDYMPLISVFFFLSILFTFISFVWFVIAEKLRTKKFKLNFLKDLKKKLKINKAAVATYSNTQPETEAEKEKEVQASVSLVNKLAFSLIFLFMLVSYAYIWCIISN